MESYKKRGLPHREIIIYRCEKTMTTMMAGNVGEWEKFSRSDRGRGMKTLSTGED